MYRRLIAFALLLTIPAHDRDEWTVVTKPSMSTPRRLQIARLDDDAFPDLIFTSRSPADVGTTLLTVWRNTGRGDLVPHWADRFESYDGGSWERPINVADFNEDGWSDLAISGVGGLGSIFLRLGDGSGTFPSEYLAAPIGGLVDDHIVVDYDGDGHLDIAAATNDFNGYVDRFTGNGAGRFTRTLPISDYFQSPPMEMAGGDVTGDGFPDEVVGDGNGLRVFQLDSDPPLLLEDYSRSPIVADLNGDGAGDIAACLPLTDEVVVLFSRGEGRFSKPLSLPTGRRPDALVAIDLDLDGDIDLAVTNVHARSVSLFHNDGLGHFTTAGRLPVGRGPVDIAAADLDLDGDVDLVVANAGDDSVSILLNPLN